MQKKRTIKLSFASTYVIFSVPITCIIMFHPAL